MSIWSEAEGTVKIPLSEHFSLKKYTHQLYDEISFYECYCEDDIRLVRLSVCLSGVKAVEFFDKWVEGIPGHVDMIVKVRMIK